MCHLCHTEEIVLVWKLCVIPESAVWWVIEILILKSKPVMPAQGLIHIYFLMNLAVGLEWKSDRLILTADHKECS